MAAARPPSRRNAEKMLASIYAGEKEMDEIINGDMPKERTEGKK